VVAESLEKNELLSATSSGRGAYSETSINRPAYR